jgi:hypothetical protein
LPPYPDACADSDINGGAYHLNSNNTLNNSICFDNCGKPRFISGDGIFDANNDPSDYFIDELCAEVTDSNRGHYHYEQYDGFLEDQAMLGKTIGHHLGVGGAGGYPAWPTGSVDLAEYIETQCGGIKVAGSLVPLTQNGTIFRNTGNNYLQWNDGSSDYRATLIGTGFMGAVALGNRLKHADYVRSFREHEINLTRVWGIEQWAGLASKSGCTGGSSPAEGLTPFTGTWAGHNYNLVSLNPAYFENLRRFLQEAADHGVVTQYSLFDKHGIINTNTSSSCEGRFASSPYRDGNNVPAITYFTDSGMDSCDCPSQCTGTGLVDLAGGACHPHPDFVDPGHAVNTVNEAFLDRIALVAGGTGNVIFEIINEATPEDWAPGESEDWQIRIASYLRAALPTYVVRDSFNGDSDGSDLDGKAVDAPDDGDGISWAASNAEIDTTTETGTGLLLGVVRATGEVKNVRGSLSLGSGSGSAEQWTARADLNRGASHATAELGFENTSSTNRLFAELTHSFAGGTYVTLYKVVNGLQAPVGVSSIISDVAPANSVQLVYNKTTGKATVYANGSPLSGMTNVSVGTVGSMSNGYFRGTNGGNAVPPQFFVDNFELTTR